MKDEKQGHRYTCQDVCEAGMNPQIKAMELERLWSTNQALCCLLIPPKNILCVPSHSQAQSLIS